MSELIGKEVLNKSSFEASVVGDVTTAKDLLVGRTGLIVESIIEKPDEIVDNPTELIPAVTKKLPTIAFIIGGLILIYFLFRSK